MKQLLKGFWSPFLTCFVVWYVFFQFWCPFVNGSWELVGSAHDIPFWVCLKIQGPRVLFGQAIITDVPSYFLALPWLPAAMMSYFWGLPGDCGWSLDQCGKTQHTTSTRGGASHHWRLAVDQFLWLRVWTASRLSLSSMMCCLKTSCLWLWQQRAWTMLLLLGALSTVMMVTFLRWPWWSPGCWWNESSPDPGLWDGKGYRHWLKESLRRKCVVSGKGQTSLFQTLHSSGWSRLLRRSKTKYGRAETGQSMTKKTSNEASIISHGLVMGQ